MRFLLNFLIFLYGAVYLIVGGYYKRHPVPIKMTTQELQEKLYEFIKPSYPEIKINVVTQRTTFVNYISQTTSLKFSSLSSDIIIWHI